LGIPKGLNLLLVESLGIPKGLNLLLVESLGIPNQLRQLSQVSSLAATPPWLKQLVLQYQWKVDLELPAKKHHRFSVRLKVLTKKPPASSVDSLDWPLVREAVCQLVGWLHLKRTHKQLRPLLGNPYYLLSQLKNLLALSLSQLTLMTRQKILKQLLLKLVRRLVNRKMPRWV